MAASNRPKKSNASFTSEDAQSAPGVNIHILRLPQVCRMTGLCRSTLYQMVAEHQFPGRVKIGARSVGWIESEVQSWLRERVEGTRGP